MRCKVRVSPFRVVNWKSLQSRSYRELAHVGNLRSSKEAGVGGGSGASAMKAGKEEGRWVGRSVGLCENNLHAASLLAERNTKMAVRRSTQPRGMLGRPSFVVERVRTLFFQLIYADQASEEAAAAQNYFVSPSFPCLPSLPSSTFSPLPPRSA